MTAQPMALSESEIERSVLVGMEKAGWSTLGLAVVRLWFEYEAIPIAKRSLKVRYTYGLKMLEVNAGSFTLDNGCPAPEPLEQLRTAVGEHGNGLPHAFFQHGALNSISQARAYSADARQRIYALAAAVVTRLHRSKVVSKVAAEKNVAALLNTHGFTSSTGQITGGHAGLRKRVLDAEHGRASFQGHYEYAMRFGRPASNDQPDNGIEVLCGALITLCRDWRLLPRHK